MLPLLLAALVTAAPPPDAPVNALPPPPLPSGAGETLVPPPPDPPVESEGPATVAQLNERDERWARREAEAPRRYLIESLAGVAGVAVGSWGSIALLSTTVCSTSSGCPTWIMPLPGIFTVPLGLFIAGRYLDSPGGYWWAVLGSLPGWLVADVTFYFVDKAAQGKFNPASYLPFLLPIIPAVIVFEWSATRSLKESEEQALFSRMMLLPGGPRGSVGASLALAF